jgi:hypothetical protein
MSTKISKIAHTIIKKIFYTTPQKVVHCSSIIKNELGKDKPSMIARFGSTEIKAILYPYLPWPFSSYLKNRIFSNMEILSGFFPSNEESIRAFSKLMIDDMKLLDILGSWRIEEGLLKKYFPTAIRIELSELEPYLQRDPWSEVLENKKILVIHPFNDTIESQYNTNRNFLFADKRVLPKFKSLETIKAVQTIAGNDSVFKDWFEALEFMKKEIDKKDFDIAIIGCGAYGFPLAAHVKRMGKKAIHMGGPTQMLFGIKGKRWIENEKFKTIINSYFVIPSDKDVPKDFNRVEGGCYW